MAVVLQHSTTAQALYAEATPSLVPQGDMAGDFFVRRVLADRLRRAIAAKA